MRNYKAFLLLLLCLAGMLSAYDWDEVAKVVASDRNAEDYFGIAVDIDGNYAVVSGRFNDFDEVEADSIYNAGAVYIYYFNGSSWTEQQKLVASDRESGDNFGVSVSIDSNYVVVGSAWDDENASNTDSLSNAGSAYVFVRNGSTWTQQQKIVAGDRGAEDNFGIYVAIDSNYIVVGARWDDEDEINDNTLSNAGSAYVFVRNGTTWTQQQKIVAGDRGINDNYGSTVGISGERIVVGARFDDEDAEGSNTLADAGSAYVYHRSGTTWTQEQKLVASDRAAGDDFTRALEINGNYIISGAIKQNFDENGLNEWSDAGAAYIFYYNGSTWSQQQKLVASDRGPNDYFGRSVSINDSYALIGALGEDFDENNQNFLTNPGAAYVFARNSTTWTQNYKICASDRADTDGFGNCGSISGTTILIGAYNQDTDENNTNTISNAGAAYFYSYNDTPLPVTLTNFEAEAINNNIVLNWTTESETDNLGFVIEKRVKGTTVWSPLASYLFLNALTGQGTTSKSHIYSYVDKEVIPGITYEYRLGDVSFDNTLTWKASCEISLEDNSIEQPETFGITKMYPNPFNPNISIEYNLDQEIHVLIQIIDLKGNIIETLVNSQIYPGEHSLSWSPDNLSTGIYFVKFASGSILQIEKIAYIK